MTNTTVKCQHIWKPTGMGGTAHICDICEAYRGPKGAITPKEWWRWANKSGCRIWTLALGDVYGEPDQTITIDHDHIAEQALSRLPRPPAKLPAIDPLDVEYDGLTLRFLLARDSLSQREDLFLYGVFRCTTAQRTAVSAYWSAELRKRVESAKERERLSVVIDMGDDW